MKNILLVDAGNTCLKSASLNEAKIFEKNSILYEKHSPIECFKDLIQANSQSINKILLVSVQGEEFANQAKEFADDAGLALVNIASLSQLGELKNAYENPEQLGADRFVAMIAAYNYAEGKPCIVIDCGTAVTIDAIDATGQHLGGLILPGLRVCSNSLLKGTQQLELNSQHNTSNSLLAKNTSQAILSGSYYGLSGAINETCSKIQKEMTNQLKRQDVVKIICGGDAVLLLPQLSRDFQIQTDLVMNGLKLIAEQFLDYWDKER